jgi:hypothetical protein
MAPRPVARRVEHELESPPTAPLEVLWLTRLNLVISQQQIAPFFDRPVVRGRPIPMPAQHDLRKLGIRPTSLRNPGATSRSNGPLFTGQWNPRCRAARGNGQAALGCRSAENGGCSGSLHARSCRSRRSVSGDWFALVASMRTCWPILLARLATCCKRQCSFGPRYVVQRRYSANYFIALPAIGISPLSQHISSDFL